MANSVQEYRRKALKTLLGNFKDQGFSVAKLSRKYSIDPSHISQLKSGHRGFGEEAARNLEEALGLPRFYFEPGYSALKSSNSELSEKNLPFDTELVPIDYGMKGQLPVISWVAAGNWTEVRSTTLKDVIDYIPRPVHLSEDAFGLIIQGQSMAPEFKPGDIIYVEPRISPLDLLDGDLIVIQCEHDTQATFKQLVLGDTPEDMYLKPLNPDWPEQEMRPGSV